LDAYAKKRLAELRRTVVEHCTNADVLIFDSQFTLEEYPRFSHFGHSTPAHALEIAKEAQVKQLVMSHHAPTRKDAKLEQMEAHYRSLAADVGIELHAAREGERIVL
jgi:ribonuclease BN (tRNA processing enzyme)